MAAVLLLHGRSQHRVRPQESIAMRRALRAILRATDLCVAEPQRVARTMVDRGLTDRYDYALETLKQLPYGVWRSYDPEDTMRFYALRLNEVGMIKSRRSLPPVLTGA